jgi:hypothetical protein
MATEKPKPDVALSLNRKTLGRGDVGRIAGEGNRGRRMADGPGLDGFSLSRLCSLGE